MEIDQRIIEFFKEENLCNEDFFHYIKDKIILVPNTTEIFWYGCHPIIENNKNLLENLSLNANNIGIIGNTMHK